MSIEDLIRSKLSTDWDVDFSDPETTPWVNVHRHEDGYASVQVLEVTPGDRDVAVRVYRAFPMGGDVAVSVDVEISGRAFAAADRTSFDYDNGERGDFSEWKEAIAQEAGGDVVLVWCGDEEPFFSFVGRTVRVGGNERVICGECVRTPNGIEARVNFDKSMERLIPETRRTVGMGMR